MKGEYYVRDTTTNKTDKFRHSCRCPNYHVIRYHVVQCWVLHKGDHYPTNVGCSWRHPPSPPTITKRAVITFYVDRQVSTSTFNHRFHHGGAIRRFHENSQTRKHPQNNRVLSNVTDCTQIDPGVPGVGHFRLENYGAVHHTPPLPV